MLKLDPSQRPGARHRLLDLGFDSLMAVQLRNRLGAGLSLARPLPASLLFDYPTIEAIKNYILELLFPAMRATDRQSRGRADLRRSISGGNAGC